MSEKIKEVHDSDLEELLEKLGILSGIKTGNIKCHFCSKTVTLESLHGVFPYNGNVCVSCDDIACIDKLAHFIGERKA